jgi:hypothetical protein
MPRGGLPELQAAIRAEQNDWIDRQGTFEDIIPSAAIVNRYISFILCAVYCFAVQGTVFSSINSGTMN